MGASTMRLSDFVLSTCALIFVLDVDKVFLRAFTSPRMQHAVRTLDLPMVASPASSALALTVALTFTITATALFSIDMLSSKDLIVEICNDACSAAACSSEL